MVGLMLAEIGEVDMFRHFPAIRFVEQGPESDRFIHRIGVDIRGQRGPALVLFDLMGREALNVLV